MKIFSWLLGLILLLLSLAFAISNRQDATISLWPLDLRVDAPLWALTLGTLLFGLLIGAGYVWLTMLPHRFEKRRLRKEIDELQDRFEDLQRTVTSTVQTVAEDFYLTGPKRPNWKFWRRR